MGTDDAGKKYTQEQLCFIALAALPKVGPAMLRKLIKRFGSATDIWTGDIGHSDLKKSAVDLLLHWRKHFDFDELLAKLSRFHAVAVTWHDPDYPLLLKEIKNPPPVLYCCGRLPSTARSVAIVGARKGSVYGRNAARLLAWDTVQFGAAVVSGGARGIDTQAHLGALEGKGKTIVVTGSGLDISYPPENETLFAEIAAQGGAVCSEFPFGTAPLPGNFPARNRIIAGMALCTAVVEADVRSGSLITADLALDEGRDVFAVPGTIFSNLSKGTNNLLRNGALPLLSAEDIAREYGWLNEEACTVPEEIQLQLSAEERLLWELLKDDEMLSAEELTGMSGLSADRLSTVLAVLELKGLLYASGGMYSRLARSYMNKS